MGDQGSKDTRRSFMSKALAGGLVLSLPIINGGQARADMLGDCQAECYIDYGLCCSTPTRSLGITKARAEPTAWQGSQDAMHSARHRQPTHSR